MSKNIYVIIEQRDGKIQKVGYELVGEATRLAKDLDQKVIGVLLGYKVIDKAELVIEHGADEVIVVDDPILEEYSTEPYAKAISKIINQLDPEIVLFGATSIGRDLAPRVAGRVHTGLTADCTSLSIDEESKLLLMTRPAFGGNIMATIVCKTHRPQMATIRPGVMTALEKDMDKKGEVKLFNVEFTESDQNIEILEVVKESKKVTDITAAKVLVSGGRGIGGPEGFDILREVAKALGGEVSSSRACVDAGWIESSRQVGQTGKTVRPNLYLACGISGAIQHVAGMEESDCIISINKNDTSAVFNVSDLGIVGDLKVIMPKLLKAIQDYKNKDEENVDSFA
ncbi:MAG: electron transfer flavoprotein subunit alpha/FixB family protein [Peptostreptococcaceae bacterium]